ncbi:hypothetical protein HPP92_027758 [Vanilla planifolia]|uniref:Protein kinase domain-containing protein n=1 Tax=Vanilla planifolia TaxID=51239 RepID=A0A835P9V7_VANPL|nr:hypothetical protein HPP92_027758 [Vanilla planifolia]
MVAFQQAEEWGNLCTYNQIILEVADADLQTRKKVPGCGPDPGRGRKQREGKLAVEEALRRWRAENAQKRRCIDNNTKFKNSYPGLHRRDPMMLDLNGDEGPSIPIREIIFSTVDRPKLLSQETDSLQEKLKAAITNSEGSLSGTWTAAILPITWDLEVDRRLLKMGDKIGCGSCGDLFRGSYLGRDVAIKVLRSDLLNETMRVEFAQELMILREVQHRNVVRFVGACTSPPQFCIVTGIFVIRRLGNSKEGAEDGSLLLRILDSWDGQKKQHKDADGLIDCSRDAPRSSLDFAVGSLQNVKPRPCSRRHCFVSHDEDDKDLFAESILNEVRRGRRDQRLKC